MILSKQHLPLTMTVTDLLMLRSNPAGGIVTFLISNPKIEKCPGRFDSNHQAEIQTLLILTAKPSNSNAKAIDCQCKSLPQCLSPLIFVGNFIPSTVLSTYIDTCSLMSSNSWLFSFIMRRTVAVHNWRCM